MQEELEGRMRNMKGDARRLDGYAETRGPMRDGLKALRVTRGPMRDGSMAMPKQEGRCAKALGLRSLLLVDFFDFSNRQAVEIHEQRRTLRFSDAKSFLTPPS
ncbi:hypothetical protein PAECIP111893_05241 [Paenibacillus plantiphilus]|uniref:Uncharacterized protein n=1 Tax=Paenibacillus plantiphilus TaxID=2905650 RepID=A0ABM9CVM6_9BACL|nr:hypothetical protein [Paenibacillus plantiphilus]CAH1225293.1 hypothetical protein PAECIP111893_05241 [Paenibacillus plantiphilus]